MGRNIQMAGEHSKKFSAPEYIEWRDLHRRHHPEHFHQRSSHRRQRLRQGHLQRRHHGRNCFLSIDSQQRHHRRPGNRCPRWNEQHVCQQHGGQLGNLARALRRFADQQRQRQCCSRSTADGRTAPSGKRRPESPWNLGRLPASSTALSPSTAPPLWRRATGAGVLTTVSEVMGGRRHPPIQSDPTRPAPREAGGIFFRLMAHSALPHQLQMSFISTSQRLDKMDWL